MKDFLVVYGTTDGHTAKVAYKIGEILSGLGATADVFNASEVPPPPDGYRMAVVAASVHAGGYQPDVVRWVRRHHELLSSRPSAFVSVCLGVLQHNPVVDRELDAIMERFFTKTNWRPTVRKIVAGALLYTKYNVIKRWTMRRIVKKAGGDVDVRRDFEYTDWAELAAFAATLPPLLANRRSIVACAVPSAAAQIVRGA